MMNLIRGIVVSVFEGLIRRFSATGRPGETIENRELVQHYGMVSRPLAGAELVILRDGNHYVAIADDDRRYRIALEDGEVALYTDEGDKIHLKRDKTIEIVSGNKLVATVENEVDITTKVAKVTASESANITSPEVTINAATSLGATSPAVTINAETSVTLNCPAISLGGSSGTMRYLVDERLFDWLINHTHGGGIKPVQALVPANYRTAIVQGG
jgi:phage gp45-like